MKILQQRDLTAEERLAARLRLAEKRVLQSTLDAVRRCADVPLWTSISAGSIAIVFAVLTAAYMDRTMSMREHGVQVT